MLPIMFNSSSCRGTSSPMFLKAVRNLNNSICCSDSKSNVVLCSLFRVTNSSDISFTAAIDPPLSCNFSNSFCFFIIRSYCNRACWKGVKVFSYISLASIRETLVSCTASLIATLASFLAFFSLLLLSFSALRCAALLALSNSALVLASLIAVLSRCVSSFTKWSCHEQQSAADFIEHSLNCFCSSSTKFLFALSSNYHLSAFYDLSQNSLCWSKLIFLTLLARLA